MQQNSKSFYCSCCNTNTTKFYINARTKKRAKFCNDCCEKYSAEERKIREIKNVYDIITKLNDKGVL